MIKGLIFDMDGTLYLGDRLFPFTKELLATIKQQGARYLFMTNNSSKSVADYVKKLEKLEKNRFLCKNAPAYRLYHV